MGAGEGTGAWGETKKREPLKARLPRVKGNLPRVRVIWGGFFSRGGRGGPEGGGRGGQGMRLRVRELARGRETPTPPTDPLAPRRDTARHFRPPPFVVFQLVGARGTSCAVLILTPARASFLVKFVWACK